MNSFLPLVVLLCHTGVLAAETRRCGATLGPTAAQIAEVIGIRAAIGQLFVPSGGQDRLRALELHQQISDRILAASLDVGSALADIDTELAQLRAIRDYLDRRQGRVSLLLNAAQIVAGSGVGIAADALSISERTTKTGNWIGVLAGATSTALSAVASLVGGPARPPKGVLTGIAPSMLTGIIETSSGPAPEYPVAVWSYLNTVPAGTGLSVTWREQLVTEWTRLGLLRREGPHRHEQAAALTAPLSSERKFDRSTLDRRSAMLFDVRARIASMNRSLRSLVAAMEARPVECNAP